MANLTKYDSVFYTAHKNSEYFSTGMPHSGYIILSRARGEVLWGPFLIIIKLVVGKVYFDIPSRPVATIFTLREQN